MKIMVFKLAVLFTAFVASSGEVENYCDKAASHHQSICETFGFKDDQCTVLGELLTRKCPHIPQESTASKQHESPQTDSLLQESITARFSYVAGASASNGNTASLAANGCKSGGTLAQAQELCNADSACTVLHDYNGDGAGWRACEKVTSGTGATTMVKVASEDDTTMDEGTSDCDVAFSNWQELCESTNDASCASSLQDLKQDCPNHSQVQAATAATQATAATEAPTEAPTESCEHHTGISGPDFLNPDGSRLKLPDGTDAEARWYVPYQEHNLADNLKGIEHPTGSGKYVDCNLASCDNPSVCGIPSCKGLSAYPGDAATKGQQTQYRSTTEYCKGAGCDIEQYSQVVKSTFPSASNVVAASNVPSSESYAMTSHDAFPHRFLPGIRFGTYRGPKYMPGYLFASPAATNTTYHPNPNYDGSWLYPDLRYCNELGWKFASKLSFAHTGVINEKYSALLLVKLTVCLKANCTGQAAGTCPTIKCYASKTGKCYKFQTDVMNTRRRVSSHSATNLDSEKAYEAFKTDNFGPCDQAVALAAESITVGN